MKTPTYLASLSVALGMLIPASVNASNQARPTLVVYAYDSFVSKWGPGAEIKKTFEEQCQCQVEYSPAKDSATLIARLTIEGAKSRADVVVGIDDSLADTPKLADLLLPVEAQLLKKVRPDILANSDKLLPFNYGHLAFMFNTSYSKSKAPPPRSMSDLLKSPQFNKMVLIQDPRSSAPGLGLLLWMHAIYGTKTKENLESLRKQVLSVARGWSDSYGFFTKGEAPLVMSYSTSEAYHREIEKTDRFVALSFEEGQYLSVEHAAILKSTKRLDLARKFMEFLLSNRSQENIASKNWMYPSVVTELNLPASFKQLAKPTHVSRLDSATIQKNKAAWIQEWTTIFAK